MRIFSMLIALMAILSVPSQTAEAKVIKRGVYGAIALQRETGLIGYSYDFKSARDAKIEALKECGDPRCEVVVNIKNSCGALARGPKKFFPATGATREEAETKALRACADKKQCQIAGWACTK